MSIKIARDIGEWLGFRVKKEYNIDNFRVDLASLKYAYDRYGSRLIYVIAKDEETVMKLINETIQVAFHEIKDQVIIVKAQELRQLHKA